MQNRHNKFLYGFALNGLNMEFEGADIVYSDYKVDTDVTVEGPFLGVNMLC